MPAQFRQKPLIVTLAQAFAVVSLGGAVMSAHADLSRLQSLLAGTPQGGWVQINTNAFSSAWPTGSVAVPNAGSSPRGVVTAWSSFAWDPLNDQLLLWGGGHANYAGNEMYRWNAATGGWSLGSLPSSLNRATYETYYVSDSAAPQSAHTYDNNLFLPVNNMFMTLGGAAYNTGGNFTTANCTAGLPYASCTDVTRAGPWLWDPTKADGNKVGGTTGSGYDPSTPGGNMWLNRAGSIVGTQGPSYVQAATANRVELINGKATDVVYLTADSQSSGFPGLYRYAVGDVRNGGTDVMVKVGLTDNTVIGQGTATIDTDHNLFVRTTDYSGTLAGAFRPDFAVWDLSKANANQPGANRDVAVRLQFADGTDFAISPNFGMDYDALSGRYLLWDGSTGGQVYSVKAAFDALGAPLPVWTVTAVASTTSSVPNGNFVAGVLGKWHYVSELGAFVALDEYSTATGDAGVWLYRPDGQTLPVPELPTPWLLTAGIGLLLTWRARRQPLQG